MSEQEKPSHQLICQPWLESERGWGTRPDGASFHLTEEDRQEYIAAYWEKMPDFAPDEYSRPTGNPFLVLATPAFFARVQAAEKGLALLEQDYREAARAGEVRRV